MTTAEDYAPLTRLDGMSRYLVGSANIRMINIADHGDPATRERLRRRLPTMTRELLDALEPSQSPSGGWPITETLAVSTATQWTLSEEGKRALRELDSSAPPGELPARGAMAAFGRRMIVGALERLTASDDPSALLVAAKVAASLLLDARTKEQYDALLAFQEALKEIEAPPAG